MKTATRTETTIERLSDGDWLHDLLFDVQRQVASSPSPQAIERIRHRLFAEIRRPVRAAA